MEFLNPVFAVIAALGFAFVFKVPKNMLSMVAVLAFSGYFVRFVCFGLGMGIELSVLCGALVIGVLGSLAAKKRDILPHTVTLASGIPMIPGSIVFDAIKYLISFVSAPKADFMLLTQATYFASKSIFIIAALAFGLTASHIIFKKS
ncbi:MAG: threonine/serine exporter family protein [Campylobacterales bacterium]|nr:threonine/serine exporter family protein [Campylobacterales bacterium]